MSERTAELGGEDARKRGPRGEGWGRGDWFGFGGITAFLLLVASVFLVVGTIESTSQARQIDAGETTRVQGTLESCGRRNDLFNGSTWCLVDTSQRLDEKSMPIEWPTFRSLERYEFEPVVGLAIDGWLVAIELPDGDVVRSAGVGWRGALFWSSIGLVFVWSAARFWRCVWLAPAWKGSLLHRVKWWWGAAACAVLDVHGRNWPVALVADVGLLIALAVLVSRSPDADLHHAGGAELDGDARAR